MAILLTTEFAVLDVSSRISTDIVKVAWLRESTRWGNSRVYYLFLWGTILLGSSILLLQARGWDVNALAMFKFTAAMNGAVMFLYSITLLILNRWMLPKPVRTSWWRTLIMLWSILFFGFFTFWAGYSKVSELLGLSE